LVGFLYQPEGEGPWPTLIWNHGSEKNPEAGPQFDTVASVFVPAGYVVFAPERRVPGDWPFKRTRTLLRRCERDARLGGGCQSVFHGKPAIAATRCGITIPNSHVASHIRRHDFVPVQGGELQ
jgi:dienelactone hydrolase